MCMSLFRGQLPSQSTDSCLAGDCTLLDTSNILDSTIKNRASTPVSTLQLQQRPASGLPCMPGCWPLLQLCADSRLALSASWSQEQSCEADVGAGQRHQYEHTFHQTHQHQRTCLFGNHAVRYDLKVGKVKRAACPSRCVWTGCCERSCACGGTRATRAGRRIVSITRRQCGGAGAANC